MATVVCLVSQNPGQRRISTKAQRLGLAVQVGQQGTALHVCESPVAVDDDAAHGGEVDEHAPVDRGEAGDRVAPRTATTRGESDVPRGSDGVGHFDRALHEQGNRERIDDAVQIVNARVESRCDGIRHVRIEPELTCSLECRHESEGRESRICGLVPAGHGFPTTQVDALKS